MAHIKTSSPGDADARPRRRPHYTTFTTGPMRTGLNTALAAAWRAPSRFSVEITLIVALKAAVLYGLWLAFFSHPLAQDMLVPVAQMDRHLMAGAEAGAPFSSSTPYSKEATHGSR